MANAIRSSSTHFAYVRNNYMAYGSSSAAVCRTRRNPMERRVHYDSSVGGGDGQGGIVHTIRLLLVRNEIEYVPDAQRTLCLCIIKSAIAHTLQIELNQIRCKEKSIPNADKLHATHSQPYFGWLGAHNLTFRPLRSMRLDIQTQWSKISIFYKRNEWEYSVSVCSVHCAPSTSWIDPLRANNNQLSNTHPFETHFVPSLI